MSMVIGVRFKRAGKVYSFDPGEFETHIGDFVVVETARGMEFGEVVSGVREVADAQIVAPLRKVVRMATEQDIRNAKANEENVRNAYSICQDKIAHHKLEMKLVDVEYAFDNSRILFYFTANGRVDFRALVKDLASVFKTRIELRQIGVRDEAKMLGGLGPCGRQICCGSYLSDFQPVSIKMAKEQSLSLNPTKISGLCGRLMCCLKYEQDTYEQLRKRMPRVGKDIMTPDGIATVLEINVLKEVAKVRIAKGDSTEIKEYPVNECSKPSQEAAQREHTHQERSGGEPKREGSARPQQQERVQRSRPKPEKGTLESVIASRATEPELEPIEPELEPTLELDQLDDELLDFSALDIDPDLDSLSD